MIHYTLENKLYRINKNVVQFFCTWNQMWWNSEISTEILNTKGIKLL